MRTMPTPRNTSAATGDVRGSADGDRHPAGRAAVLLLVAIVAGLTIWTVARHEATVVHAGYRSLVRPGHEITNSDLDPLTYFASTVALSGARDVIPRDASYSVVVGKIKPPFSALPGPSLNVNPTSLKYAFRLWLLPRTYAPLRRAQWVIAYDISPDSLGVKYTDMVLLGPDAFAVKVVGR